MADEIHIGIKFEPWGGGAHVGKLERAPERELNVPMTTLAVDGQDVYLWWLDGKKPADAEVAREVERTAHDLARRHLKESDERGGR